MNKYTKVIFFIGLLTLLSSCAIQPLRKPERELLPAPTVHKTWAARKATLSTLTRWTTRGAVSIRYPKKAIMASYAWQQDGRLNYRMALFGPLNIGGVQIIGRPGKVVLWTSRKKAIAAKTPEALMQRQLGWRIPISNLFYWVRGLPAPSISAKTKFDAQNQLIYLAQQGWRIYLSRYRRVGKFELPTRLTMISARLRVTLTIKSWKLD